MRVDLRRIRGTFHAFVALAGIAAAEPVPQGGSEEPPALSESEIKALGMSRGPMVGSLEGLAEIQVPAGYLFAKGDGTRKLLKLQGNLTNDTEKGVVMSEDLSWFLVFEFSEIGYVKDDEKDKLDADAILSSLKEGNEAANGERRRRGLPTLDVVGWEQPPHYDAATHNLEWATRARALAHFVVNQNTRLLGRRGVMEVTLVCGPEDFRGASALAKEIVGTFRFTPEQAYASFRRGDKIAEYGLTALVAGGALAAAAKSGLLGKLWKVIVVGVLAVVAAIGKAISRLFGGKTARQAA